MHFHQRSTGLQLFGLGDIAVEQAVAGDIRGVKATLDQIERGAGASELAAKKIASVMRTILGDLVWALYEIQEPKNAEIFAARIDLPSRRAWAYGLIAQAYARKGDFDAARKAAGKINDPATAADALRAIARGLARTGMLEQLRAWSKQLKSPTARAAVASGAAEGLLQIEPKTAK